MLKLNFSNVEELIFYDTEAQKMLDPELFSTFEQWRLSKRVPYLDSIGKQAMLDFLNNISDNDVLSLENYFGKKIIIEKFNYKIVKNIKVPIEKIDICNELCKIESLPYYSTFRDQENLYITFWR